MGDFAPGIALFLAVPLLILMIAFLDVVIRRPLVAVWLVLVCMVVEDAFGAAAQYPIGPVSTSPSDVVVVLLMAAAVARLLRVRDLSAGQRLLVAVLVMLFLSAFRGYDDFGQPAFTEFRRFLKFYGPAMYFATIRPDDLILGKLGRWWVNAALALTGLLALRILSQFIGFDLGALDPVHASSQYVLKSIPGPTSFVVGQAFIIALAAAVRNRSAGSNRGLAVLFGVVVVLMNRRTVWVTVLIGLGVLLLRSGPARRHLTGPLTTAIVVASAALFFLSAEAGLLSEGEDLAASATDTGTLVGRAEGWADLLGTQGPRGAKEWIVGQPMGTGFTREIQELQYAQNPHNYYVQTVTRGGVVALAALALTYVWVLYWLRKVPNSAAALSGATLLVMMVMQVIFIGLWQARIEQGMLLGVGVAAAVYARRAARASAPLPTRSPIPVGA